MKEKQLLEAIEVCIRNAEKNAQVAEELALIEISDLKDYSKNGRVLAGYISGFQFDWDNETYDSDEKKLSEAIEKIKQILTDTKAGNDYKSRYSAELAYSRLKDGEYEYKIIKQNMEAITSEGAENECREIRIHAKKEHPDDMSFTLEDVRIREQIIDQKGNIILDEFEAYL
jgi:hypothetical protein